MYNKIKVCKNKDCNFEMKYDSSADRLDVTLWDTCPKCSAELEIVQLFKKLNKRGV